MQRKSFDRMISWIGLTLTVLLVVAGSLLTWANTFVEDQVRAQLSQQQIFFPEKGSESISTPEYADMQQYAGQQLTTGAQAQVYADVYIANHLKGIGGGKTYAQLSQEAQANPTDTELAAKVNSMFKGETLRGLLLNAYAFGTMGSIAGIAAIASFIGAGTMLVLSALGLWHSSRVREDETVLAGRREPVEPVTV